jgi:hypothetical protein
MFFTGNQTYTGSCPDRFSEKSGLCYYNNGSATASFWNKQKKNAENTMMKQNLMEH